MSSKAETQISVPHPRETTDLFGHGEAETALLNAYRSGRIPHAWLIGGAQGGLLVLQRTANDKGVMRTVITVDETRETISFFGSTAAAEGWRVCIVDTVDELNPNAANALLKTLEEPPRQSLFLLVSHAPGRVLPTILSRCRRLPLRPLAKPDVIQAVSRATGRAGEDAALIEAAEAAEGSVARALTLLGGDAVKLHHKTA